MSNYFLGEIRLFPYAEIPKNWAPCQGQLLSIQQYQALFTLLGTVYGGNGIQTFGLPDLQGRTPFGTSPTAQGLKAGSETVTLTLSNLPPHTHNVHVNSGKGTEFGPPGNFLATDANGPAGAAFNVYANQAGNPGATLNDATITVTGSTQPHENRQPSLAMSYCISLSGIFPTRG